MARRRGARGPRLHIFWSIILTVAVLAVPGAVVAWGRSTSTFTTERVVVTGARMIPKKEARRALQKSLLGENLFAVGADDVREALRRFCYLADVEIDRDFPETLRVRLVEHRPALAVLAEGRWFLVSDTGHVICEAPPKGAATRGGAESGGADTDAAQSGDASATSATSSPAPAEEQGAAAAQNGEDAVAADDSGDAAPADDGEGGATDGAAKGGGTLEDGPDGKTENKLPRLRVAEKLRPGAQAADAKVQTAVKTLAGLSASLRRQVTLLEVTKSLRVTATLRDGLVVRFGDATRLGDKVIALRAVRGVYRRAGRTPTYIDVSVPERPLGRPLLKR